MEHDVTLFSDSAFWDLARTLGGALGATTQKIADRDVDGNVRTDPSANYGKGKRWRAGYVDDESSECAKGFARKTDAHKWVEVTAKFATGTYIEPSAGRVTVAAVYQSCRREKKPRSSR
jgi:hypothetical protein